MNSNSTMSFCHCWFIVISWISFVIDIKFYLHIVAYDDLTFNYCMILLISWEINHIIVVNSEDCYSLMMQLYVNLDLPRGSKLLREEKCDEKTISIIFNSVKVTCAIIQIHFFCFLCVNNILSSTFMFFLKSRVSN